MEKVRLEKITKGQAAAAMRAACLLDPTGLHTPESIAQYGECYELETAGGKGVFVAEKRKNQLWIHGAGAVASTGMAAAGLDVVEALADCAGCDSVAFQTGRAGLVRIAKKQGYRITGFIMEKRKK